MTDPLMKLVPVAVNVNAPVPAVALFGDRVLSTGNGLVAVTTKAMAELVPPPGRGVNTVTAGLPATAIFDAGTVAVNCVGLMNVVASGAPFQFTTEPLIKLLPVTVSVKPAVPATAVVGLMAVAAGTGLLTMTVLIVNVDAPLVPPPGAGVTTVTADVPAVAIFAAGTAAVS